MNLHAGQICAKTRDGAYVADLVGRISGGAPEPVSAGKLAKLASPFQDDADQIKLEVFPEPEWKGWRS